MRERVAINPHTKKTHHLTIMAKNINGKRVSILSNVKETYKHCYPTDVLGDSLDGNISFAQVIARMQEGEDFSNIIKVNDSIVREHIFIILTAVGGVKYDDIYTMWLNQELLKTKYLDSIF